MKLDNTVLLGETGRHDFQFPKSVMVTWWAPERAGLEATPAPLTLLKIMRICQEVLFRV